MNNWSQCIAVIYLCAASIEALLKMIDDNSAGQDRGLCFELMSQMVRLLGSLRGLILCSSLLCVDRSSRFALGI